MYNQIARYFEDTYSKSRNMYCLNANWVSSKLLAQSVEHETVNLRVVSSGPTLAPDVTSLLVEFYEMMLKNRC